MASSAASQRLERVERFLDNIDKVKTPGDLQDPFRSLWLRIHGEKPTMMSDERREALLSGGFSRELFGDVQVTSAGKGREGSIEVISPKDVGPTVQMEMEEDRVTFKMAKEDELKNLEERESSADLMISLQNKIEPLSGLGGEVAKVWEGITEIAREYKKQNYRKAKDLGKVLDNKIDTDDFRKSVVVELQKKINEYEDLGADTSTAKGKFKDLAASLKNEDSDFIKTAGEVNNALESSLEGIVEEEIVAQVKGAPEEKEAVAPKPKRIIKRKITREAEEEKEEPDTREDEEPPSELDDKPESPVPDETESEEKPVIKIVTVKKLVPVQKVKKERKEYDEQVKGDRPSVEKEAEITEKEVEKEVEKAPSERSESQEKEPVPETEKKEKAPLEEEPGQKDQPQEKKEGSHKTEAGKEAARSEVDEKAVQDAFKKYQFVYNASLKMHEAGKDMSQLFDLMNYAEQSRKKGDMKTYVGICNQMESMLISLQS